MSQDSPAIHVEGVVKRYGDRTVLDGVTLSVRAGEVVALLGPNGAGKTTTIEIVEGYRTADSGHVSVLGQDPALGGPAHRARVGHMLQSGGLDPRARPLELIRLYRALHRDGRDPDELVDLVRLRSVASTPFRRLSGGERQRLALALALVGTPEVLILDEPTAGMDPEAKRDTRELIGQMRDAGLAVLLTTHDLADVEHLADRVAILHGGVIVADGTIEALTEAGASPFEITVRVDRAPSERERASLDAALASWAAVGDLRIQSVRIATSTLEDRYFALTSDVAEGSSPRSAS